MTKYQYVDSVGKLSVSVVTVVSMDSIGVNADMC